MNRGADYVKYLVPSLRARTRYLTGHREPHNQATLACAAPGAGQHRDYTAEIDVKGNCLHGYIRKIGEVIVQGYD